MDSKRTFTKCATTMHNKEIWHKPNKYCLEYCTYVKFALQISRNQMTLSYCEAQVKSHISVALLCLVLTYALPVRAEDKVSCDDLAELSDALAGLTDWITSEAAQIEEGSEEDKSLGEMIKELGKIAKAGNSDRLDTAIKALRESWKDENGEWEQFSVAMAITTYEFDRIYYQSACEKKSDEEYTASELSDVAYTLRQIYAAVEARVEIKDGSHLDGAFENLLADLKELVDATQDKDLKKQVRSLQKAWTDMDWDAFAEICDDVANTIEEL